MNRTKNKLFLFTSLFSSVFFSYAPVGHAEEAPISGNAQPQIVTATQQGTKATTPKRKNTKKGEEPQKDGVLSPQAERSLELNEQGAAALRGKDFVRAEQLFKQSLTADSKNLTAAYNLAGVYITNKNEKEAITLLRSYTTLYPDDAGLLVRLGDALFGNQEVKAAVEQYKKALEKDATYPGIAAKLGTLLSLQGDLPQAARMYEAALKINPKDPQVLSNLSSLYVGLSRPKEAVATAKAALQLTPTRDLYVTLGNAYLDLKENTNALHAFERAASFGSTNQELSKQIEDLRASLKSNL
jgi:tetratricopeptide (TPR) repeat protein